MTPIELAGIAWGTFATALGIYATLKWRKAERRIRGYRRTIREDREEAWGYVLRETAIHNLNRKLTEDLGIARAEVAKWKTRWGNTSRLLGIAERANSKLVTKLLRYEQEAVEQ